MAPMSSALPWARWPTRATRAAHRAEQQSDHARSPPRPRGTHQCSRTRPLLASSPPRLVHHRFPLV
eukprot:3446683-Pyramimonas_sp.AAC.1